MTQIRFPTQKHLEKVPEYLEEVFHGLDNTGIAAFSRGNGIYEITDAPLNTLRDRVRTHVTAHLGGMVTDKEAAFLEKCGIQARNGYKISPKVAHTWLDRWSLLGTSPYKGAFKNFKIKIEIPKGTPYIHPQLLPIAVRLLEVTYLKLAWASGLKPSELPQTISFVSPELTNHTALIAEVQGDLPKLCGQLQDVARLDDNGAALGKFVQKLDRALEQQKHHTRGKTIVVVENFLEPIGEAIAAMIKIPDPADQARVINMLMSVFAFPLAHELGHQQMYVRGESLHQKVVDTISASQVPELAPSYSMLRGTVTCAMVATEYEGIIESVLNGGMFLPGTIDAVKNHYHNGERDAEILGEFMALRAGFDPASASATLLSDIPESLTHPAEADTIALLKQMADDAVQMGFTLSATQE